MFTGLDWCAGACAMMGQKLCWRRYAAGGLLLACGVTEEGRTDGGRGGEARGHDDGWSRLLPFVEISYLF